MEINLNNKTPNMRQLKDVVSVIYDKEWLKTADLNLDLYFMYRGLESKNGLRYDITITPAKMLGSEFVKTMGHYHNENYGEIYTVLEGTAIYLMQKIKDGKDDEIEDCYFVKAEKGDSVIIPSFYGHITINPTENQELKMANWVSEKCKSDYTLFEKLKGGCYYFTKEGWVKNKNYKDIPDLRFEEPLKEIPANLNFLK